MQPQPETAVLCTLRALEHMPAARSITYGLPRQPRKVWAAAVRKLLKEAGITGVSVTAPSYSQAHSIDIELPRHYETCEHWRDGLGMNDCPNCADYAALRDRARVRLTAVICWAFPDLTPPGGSKWPHEDSHDFCFTIS